MTQPHSPSEYENDDLVMALNGIRMGILTSTNDLRALEARAKTIREEMVRREGQVFLAPDQIREKHRLAKGEHVEETESKHKDAGRLRAREAAKKRTPQDRAVKLKKEKAVRDRFRNAGKS